jgi:hypothetical protein
MNPTDHIAARPPGEYAIVELLGHMTLVGRIAEAERFGAKMMVIEPIFRGELLPPVFQGGASIYRITPCTAEVAFARGATAEYQLPTPIRATLPAALLAASADEFRAAESDVRDWPEGDEDDAP